MKLSEDWCDFNDMPQASCAHCRDVPAPELGRPKLEEVVVAVFDGECPVCGEDIEAGKEIIGRINHEGADWHRRWAHYGCGS